MSSLGLKDCYVGSQAQNLRGILSISQPIRQGVVQDWDDLETIWTHVMETELKAEASDQPLLITQMPLTSQEDESRMAEILMEKMAVPAMFIANKSVMSLYGGGNMTGISVDSGHDTTYLGQYTYKNYFKCGCYHCYLLSGFSKYFLFLKLHFSAILPRQCHPRCHSGPQDWRKASNRTFDEPADEWKIFLPG